MKKEIISIVIVLLLGGCVNPPPPHEAVNDGRGMVPINPKMITQEQINAASSKYKEVNKKQVTELKEFANGH